MKLVGIERCIFKGVAISTTPEAEAVRQQFKVINFVYCERSCHGFNDRCDNYRANLQVQYAD